MAQKNTIFGKTILVALALFVTEGNFLGHAWSAPTNIDQEILEPQSNNIAEDKSSDKSVANEPAKKAPQNTDSQPQYPDIRPPTRILPSKITPLQNNLEGGEGMSKAAPEIKSSESVGQLELLTLPTPTTDNTESLKLVYDGPQDRDDLLKLFKGLSPSSHSITAQEIAVWLLSNLAADSSETAPSKETKDDDIYSLRLVKLLQFGELQKVLLLYKMNEGQPPSTTAAKAGIIAMLAQNEAAVACLEEKALPENLTNNDKAFWGKVDLFCKGLLSPAAGEDDQLRYGNAARIYITASGAAAPATLADFNKLDEITQLSFAEKGVIPADVTADNLKHIGTLPLALILSRKHAISEDKLGLLLAEASKRGLLHSADLSRLAQELTELKQAPESAPKQKTKTDTKTNDYSSKLIQILNNASDLNNLKLPQSLKDSVEASLTIAALRESSELPVGIENIALPDQPDAKRAATIFSYANQTVPENWMMSALAVKQIESADKTPKSRTGDDIFCEYFLLKGNDTDKSRTATVTAIQPFLSSFSKSPLSTEDIYDNIFNLTDSSNYVMPSNDILSSLKREAIKKPSKQAVTESLSILSAQPVETLHPAALYRVLNVLKSAGLSVQTKSLGHEVLGHILEN